MLIYLQLSLCGTPFARAHPTNDAAARNGNYKNNLKPIQANYICDMTEWLCTSRTLAEAVYITLDAGTVIFSWSHLILPSYTVQDTQTQYNESRMVQYSKLAIAIAALASVSSVLATDLPCVQPPTFFVCLGLTKDLQWRRHLTCRS